MLYSASEQHRLGGVGDVQREDAGESARPLHAPAATSSARFGDDGLLIGVQATVVSIVAMLALPVGNGVRCCRPSFDTRPLDMSAPVASPPSNELIFF
jgi:hypothetical protein